MPADAQTALIGIDWGTTSFRAYRVDPTGAVIDEVEAAEGITNPPPGGFEQTFERYVGPWADQYPGAPILASGMITSRNGWCETPYANAPAGAVELAAALTEHRTGAGHTIRFISGLLGADRSGSPDVMRGEETQLVGCAATGISDGIFVMPGTHSKWATVAASRLTGFRTYMTGEVFAVMRQHSLLGAFIDDNDWSNAAFEEGIRASLAGSDSILHLLFTARSLVLTEHLPASASSAYLSGLLIGEELRAAKADLRDDGSVTVVGSGALVDRYVAALTIAGIPAKPAPDAAVARGHFEIAKEAGLLQ